MFLSASGGDGETTVDPRWFVIVGLASDLIGASFITYGLMISKEKAIEISVSRWSPKDDEENLKLPQVRDRLKQSWNAKIGLAFLAIGFLLQLIGNWPR
jgi:hypothetical protein